MQSAWKAWLCVSWHGNHRTRSPATMPCRQMWHVSKSPSNTNSGNSLGGGSTSIAATIASNRNRSS
tara:strand:+ start:1008 stop:1205 length:198 start_codon:yes stop_codon:yes gene_type:complete